MKYTKLTSKSNHNNGYVAVTLIVGLAVGAILSILFAGENGEDTRKIISNKAKGLAISAKHKYAALKNKIKDDELEIMEDAVAPEVPYFVYG